MHAAALPFHGYIFRHALDNVPEMHFTNQPLCLHQ